MELDLEATFQASRMLSKCVNASKGDVKGIRDALKMVVDPNLEPDEVQPFNYFASKERGKDFSYPTFEDYLQRWCSYKFDELERLFSNDEEMCLLLTRASRRPVGGGKNQYTHQKPSETNY